MNFLANRAAVACLFIFVAALMAPGPAVGGDGDATTIWPIEDLFVDGAPTITDLRAFDGTLRFVSRIPVACSVVYGATPAFDNITVDQDMAGGAHTDHHPTLSGLSADTLYYYRVQRTAADGTLYMSGVSSFRTLPAPTDGPANLAALAAGARVVAVSSNYGGGNGASWCANSAIDGSRATPWSSNGDSDDGFIEIELARETALGAIEVWTRSMFNNTTRIFTFTLITDGGDSFKPFELPDATRSIVSSSLARACTSHRVCALSVQTAPEQPAT